MKRLISYLGFCLLGTFLFFGCRHHHRISLQISESDTRYKIFAEFDRRNTTEVDRCLNKYLTGRNDMSFVNSRIDGQLMLDDRTTFIINKRPGLLEIDFDKEKNSARSYEEIKALGEGLRSVVK